MNIPFYRHVRYEDDGVSRYQCLKCGEEIMVRAWYQPNFCPDCGIPYKGMILDKKLAYINFSKRERNIYIIEEAFLWNDEKDFELNWEPTWEKSRDVREILKYKKDLTLKEEEDKETAFLGKRIFRVRRVKEEYYPDAVVVDTVEFYRKTGKHFKEEDYLRREKYSWE